MKPTCHRCDADLSKKSATINGKCRACGAGQPVTIRYKVGRASRTVVIREGKMEEKP